MAGKTTETHATEESASPLNTHTSDHLGSEQWKAGTSERSKEGICRNRRSREHQIRVNQAAEVGTLAVARQSIQGECE